MINNDLLLSEAASKRAREFISKGDMAKAADAYVEAADYMLRFSSTQEGTRREDAQKLTEQLLLKAKEVKVRGNSRNIQPEIHSHHTTSDSSADLPQTKKNSAPQMANNNNRNAINRDIEGFRRTRNKTEAISSESVLKFMPVESPNVYFSDIAGLENVKEIVRLKIIHPILHPELYERFSKNVNGGILLYGPPGTGKTMIARAIATETNLDFYSVRCSDVVGKSFGDGERNLKALFDAARSSGHAMIFFDEFESLAPKRGGNSTVMNRIVPELLSQMDGFQKAEGQLIVLASTNRPWDLDSAVLRPPRMTERIYVGLPDYTARLYMVKKSLDSLPKKEDPDYDFIAKALEGYNCADIVAFVEKVKESPIQRGLQNQTTEEFITGDDIKNALAASHSSVQQTDLEAFSKWEASQR